MALKRENSTDSLCSFVSYSNTQGFIAVPADLGAKVLKEGYVASKRSSIPITLTNDPEEAVKAMRSHNATTETLVLEVHDVPEELIDRKNCKIKLTHLPSKHLSDGHISIPMRTSDYQSEPCPFCNQDIPEFAELRGRPGEHRYFGNATFMCSPCPNEECKEAQIQRQERLKQGDPIKLYHQTSRRDADLIHASGRLIRGANGAAGGGIYLAESVRETEWKAEHHGVVLECEVNVGNMKELIQHDKKAVPISFADLVKEGVDSVKIDRGKVPNGPHAGEFSGYEYVIYSWDQVKVLREVPRQKRTCPCCKDKPDKP